MKILITGANGQLAKTVTYYNKVHDLILATKSVINIEDRRDVYQKITMYKPDIVYHFASMTRGDECAANPKKAYKVNVTGTRHIARITAKLGIPIVFVSTNEVFDGTKQTPYTESDIPNPKTVVGKNKYKAEQIIITTNPQHYIVRTMWLYSEWSNNFIQAIVKKSRNNASINLVSDEIGSPTNTSDLAQAIMLLSATGKYGVYHIANTGSASRLDFGREVFNKLKINITIRPVLLNDFKRASKPPKYSVLESKKISKMGILMRDWQSALNDFLTHNSI
jgi:dTDP-4-dehydrorhamnose reductase